MSSVVWTLCRKAAGMLGLCALCLLSGCPSNTNTNNNNTNNNNSNTNNNNSSVVECKAGAACLEFKDASIRSCEALLTNDKAIESPQIGFDDGVIGQYKARDSRLAVSFLLRKDNALETGQYAVVIRLKDSVKQLKIDKINCYDRKGVKLDNPDVQIRRP